MKKYKICIVGATGLVGRTILDILHERDFPIADLKLLASKNSQGKKLSYKDKEYLVEELDENSFSGYDLALFSAGGDISKKFAPIARDEGLIVIDNSSQWREDENIGLVVPEINLDDAKINPLIANPNCSTIQSVLPLAILDKTYGLKQVNYTTFQAVSGSGQKGYDDLVNTRQGKKSSFYPHNISETAIPEIDVFLDNGYTKEEMKMINETRKILHHENLPVSATCVRVPVLNGHGVSIQVSLDKKFNLADIKEVLAKQEGIVVLDNNENHEYPVSTIANGKNDVYVGRIRRDLSLENSLLLYCVADNIRKGAALNAVQIAEGLIKKGVI